MSKFEQLPYEVRQAIENLEVASSAVNDLQSAPYRIHMKIRQEYQESKEDLAEIILKVLNGQS